MSVDEDKLLSVSDVCRVLGIGKSTWYSWRKRGHGPPVVPIGPPGPHKKRLVRVRHADLLDWLGGQS